VPVAASPRQRHDRGEFARRGRRRSERPTSRRTPRSSKRAGSVRAPASIPRADHVLATPSRPILSSLSIAISASPCARRSIAGRVEHRRQQRAVIQLHDEVA
jgi:hypothetical protein